MKDAFNSADSVITYSYREYHQIILAYISCRINHKYEAEDLTQDVFMRLVEYKSMIRIDTVKYFLFTIARNIVTDYIRRYYKKQEITSYVYDASAQSVESPEELYIAKDILLLEKKRLETFPHQRRIIYSLNRFGGKTTGEISADLDLSRRTVENHLLTGRKIMRSFIRQCI